MIDLSSALTVRFGDCDAGWISMWITAKNNRMEVRLSHIYDPIPDLLAWLESITIGVQKCGFSVDEEGSFTYFDAIRSQKSMRLKINKSYGSIKIDLDLTRRELVKEFYESLINFAHSDQYIPSQWETSSLADIVERETGKPVNEWIDFAIHLDRRNLQKQIWRFDPQITQNPLYFEKEFTGSEEELLELTGKNLKEAHGLPYYWSLNDWEDIKNETDRRYYLMEECLSENVISWKGCPLRKMRSPLIENWLASPEQPEWMFWRRWLL